MKNKKAVATVAGFFWEIVRLANCLSILDFMADTANNNLKPLEKKNNRSVIVNQNARISLAFKQFTRAGKIRFDTSKLSQYLNNFKELLGK